MEPSAELRQQLLVFQRNEITEHHIYKRLAKSVCGRYLAARRVRSDGRALQGGGRRRCALAWHGAHDPSAEAGPTRSISRCTEASGR